MYSSAIFPHEAATLDEASQCKLQRVVNQLDLRPTDRVLEIGSGWGGFALYAAGHTGCHVTTTTVSRRQHAYVVEQVRRAGLSDLVTVLDQDYRDLTGTFDKLVSIEMIEAVDWRDHDLFFGTCAARLRRGGQMLLQAILIADDRFERAKNTHEFMREFIFPGGCLPSAASVQRCLDTAGLHAVDWFETGPHYVRTLREWRHRFDAAAPELARIGYDRRFRRMWRFYLAYCEAAFAEGHVHGTQLLIRKPA
jgi:cyclopropane-fatty-acyl-phospholipid synthase